MDACHRLPAKKQQQRPIIVKFHDRATKANVCSKKKELRGTKFVIREDLTRTRHFLMVEAKKKYGNRSVWSNNVVSETWLDNAIPNESIHIQGYLVVRKDRVTRGGGVCIYIRESLRVVPLSCSTSIEQAWVGVEIGCTKLALGVFYKPPNFHYKLFCDYLEEQVTTVSMEYDMLICLGDININMCHTSTAPDKVYLLNMLESVGLTQVINSPTRCTNLLELSNQVY
ncbi:hypothetical protein QE152_g27714 [Popillia japonica]|uniref:Tick transposon n=1 Tax=Popillia japonica TaxID=7064 RepID=A0AAW1JTF9_POPJA